MRNEAEDHLVGALGIADTFEAHGVDRKFLKNPSCRISNQLITVLQDFIQVLEAVFHQVGLGSIMRRKSTNKKSSLLSHLRESVLHKSGCDRNEVVIDHLISRFLMMYKLIKCLESVSALGSFEILLE